MQLAVERMFPGLNASAPGIPPGVYPLMQELGCGETKVGSSPSILRTKAGGGRIVLDIGLGETDGRGDSGCGQSRLCCDSIRADAQSHTPHPQKGPLTRYARQRPLCRPGAQRWRHMAGITTDRGAHSRGVCLHRQCSPRCNTRDGGLAEHLFVWRKLQYA